MATPQVDAVTEQAFKALGVSPETLSMAPPSSWGNQPFFTTNPDVAKAHRPVLSLGQSVFAGLGLTSPASRFLGVAGGSFLLMHLIQPSFAFDSRGARDTGFPNPKDPGNPTLTSRFTIPLVLGVSAALFF